MNRAEAKTETFRRQYGSLPKDGAPLTSLLKASVVEAKNGGRGPVVPVDLPPGVRQDRKTGDFILPKTDAAKADLLYQTKQARYALQHRVDTLQKLQTAIEAHFIENLPRSQASGIAGQLARVQIENKPVPQVKDWTGAYAFIKKNNAFELLQRRLNEGAVKERLEAGQRLEFIEIFQAKKVSVTKL